MFIQKKQNAKFYLTFLVPITRKVEFIKRVEVGTRPTVFF